MPEDSATTALGRIAGYGIVAVGLLLSCFHLYATWAGVLSIMRQRVVHVGLVIIIALLAYVQGKLRDSKGRISAFEWAVNTFILVTAAVSTLYLVSIDTKIVFHLGSPTNFEIVLGIALTLSLLEVTRRAIGPIMPGIALVAVMYALFGRMLPFGLGHKGYNLARVAGYLLLSEDGIFGVPVGVSAMVVVMFIIFGALLQKSGAGESFIDMAFAFFGRVRGGPAKVAVVASALFGTISGSAIANVVATGTFTIPLMKSVGYQPHFAGAVEAVASTGGQIMPPIMGAAAFIMAQILAVPYMEIAKAAIIPALLYFLTVYVVVDMEAVKKGLKGLPASELPDAKKTFRHGWFLIMPIVILLYLLIFQKLSPNKAALYASVGCIIVSWFGAGKRMRIKEVCEALVDASREICSVALACATAGVVIGMMGLTGLGLKMSSLLVEWSNGNVYLLTILTALTGIVLGMGLPTSGVYIILSVTAAPALMSLGVSPLSAHMFVFYFGIIAAITPPVALASYAGAGIAKADANLTGWTAVKIGVAGFIVPFIFVLRPAILGIGTPLEVTQVAVSSTVAIIALCASLNGVPYDNIVSRVLLGAAALLLVGGGTTAGIIGMVAIAAAFVYGKTVKRKGAVRCAS